jgi:DNA-binding beta-propeller fold protein YncE
LCRPACRTGPSQRREGTTDDFATIGYDGATGRRLWVRRFGSRYTSYPLGAASAPDGSSVVVTGYVFRAATGGDFATLAYDGATGSTRWSSGFSSAGANHDTPLAIAMSPDGERAYVTGESWRGRTSGEDVSTLAYDVATGTRLWSWFSSGSGRQTDVGWSVAASLDGSKAFVAGRVGSTQPDYITIAYAA